MAKATSGANSALRDWNDIRFVLAVAATGSFIGAGRLTGTHETTVARRVQRLEDGLGTRLFVRHPRGMVPTAAGEMLVRRAKEIEDATLALQENVAGLDARLAGRVRLTVPEGIGVHWLTPALTEFQAQFPEIQLEVLTDGTPVGPNENDADLSMSINRPTNERLIVKRVGELHYRLFCSNAYLVQRAAPRSEDELKDHALLRLRTYDRDPQLRWWTNHVDRAGAPYATNSTSLYVASVRAGLGIGMMAGFYTVAAADLVVLDITPPCKTGLWLASAPETNKRGRIRMMSDFLQDKLARTPGVLIG